MFLMRLWNSCSNHMQKKERKSPSFFNWSDVIFNYDFGFPRLLKQDNEVHWLLCNMPRWGGWEDVCGQRASAPERQQSCYVPILVGVHASAGCSCVGFLLHHSSGRMKPPAADMLGFYFCHKPTQRFCTKQIVLDRKLVSKQNKAPISNWIKNKK